MPYEMVKQCAILIRKDILNDTLQKLQSCKGVTVKEAKGFPVFEPNFTVCVIYYEATPEGVVNILKRFHK